MRSIRTIVVASALALATSACGGLNDAGAGGSSGGGNDGVARITHPTGADELVLRWSLEGGFVPYEYTLKRLPSWSLYGDGRIVVEGPMIEIYPAPALPNVLVRRVNEDAVQAILRAAQDAGLTGGDASYDYRCITDAPTTVFTTNADGATSLVSAYALDMGGGDCPGVDEAARRELSRFVARLADLSWLPEGSVGEEEPFVAERLRVYVMPYAGQPDLPQQPMAWPLDVPLDRFGRPAPGGLADTRCGVVEGTDVATLLSAAQTANDLTPWMSDGERHRLILRPLLPDERGC